jgi:hypothetical protein
MRYVVGVVTRTCTGGGKTDGGGDAAGVVAGKCEASGWQKYGKLMDVDDLVTLPCLAFVLNECLACRSNQDCRQKEASCNPPEGGGGGGERGEKRRRGGGKGESGKEDANLSVKIVYKNEMRRYSIRGALGGGALQDLKEQVQESFAELHDAWTTAGTTYDIRHTTYDIRHTTYDIRHTAYDIRHTTYDIRHTTYDASASIPAYLFS